MTWPKPLPISCGRNSPVGRTSHCSQTDRKSRGLRCLPAGSGLHAENGKLTCQYAWRAEISQRSGAVGSQFALAWALLSYVDALGYLTLTLQPTVALRDETGQAAETALALQPNLGEAILAKGYYYYACLKDYDAAVRYFEKARQFLPNSSQIPESLANVARDEVSGSERLQLQRG